MCVSMGGCLLVGSNLLDDEDPQCSGRGDCATVLHQCNHDCRSPLCQQHSQTLSHLLSLFPFTHSHSDAQAFSSLQRSLTLSLSLSQSSFSNGTDTLHFGTAPVYSPAILKLLSLCLVQHISSQAAARFQRGLKLNTESRIMRERHQRGNQGERGELKEE